MTFAPIPGRFFELKPRQVAIIRQMCLGLSRKQICSKFSFSTAVIYMDLFYARKLVNAETTEQLFYLFGRFEETYPDWVIWSENAYYCISE